MASASNVDRKSEDKQKLISALMGQDGLCHKYNDLKQNRGYTDFIFPVDDIKKATEEGGFGITAYERPHLDELLRMIQDEDMLIEVLDEERRRLDQGGINGCKEMYLAMSYERYLL